MEAAAPDFEIPVRFGLVAKAGNLLIMTRYLRSGTEEALSLPLKLFPL